MVNNGAFGIAWYLFVLSGGILLISTVILYVYIVRSNAKTIDYELLTVTDPVAKAELVESYTDTPFCCGCIASPIIIVALLMIGYGLSLIL
jgi:hypothetical protein